MLFINVRKNLLPFIASNKTQTRIIIFMGGKLEGGKHVDYQPILKDQRPYSTYSSSPSQIHKNFPPRRFTKMWQVLLAAAIAGTGMCAKNLFFNKNRHPIASPPPPQTEQKTHDECDQNQSGDVGGAEEIVTFSSSGVSKKPRNRLRGFKKKVKVERFSRCFKKKRTSKATFVKSSTG